MDSLNIIFGWGSPIGTGLFMVFVASFIFILSRIDKNSKK